MLTIEEIRQKVDRFPTGGSAEDLLTELLLLYRANQGMEEIKNGNVKDWIEFKKEMEIWLRSK